MDHGVNIFGYILAAQYLAALAVDDLALAVHHVVELQHVFADGEVAGLQLFLGVLDGAGNHLVLNGHVFLDAQGIHDGADALAAEQAHEVVLQADEEAAGAGVALAAGTAAQLVVDAAALVAFRADDEQAARGAHLGGFFRDDFFVRGLQIGIARAHL